MTGLTVAPTRSLLLPPGARPVRRAVGAAAGALLLGLTAACGSDTGSAQGEGGAVIDQAPPASAEGDASGVGTDTSPPPATPAPPADGGTGPVLVLQDAEVELEEQSGDGSSVEVEEVRLPGQPGFVVVHRSAGDRPGEVLGAAPVQAGESNGARVDLDTPLTESGRITVVLHVDDGDGAFDPLVDPRVLDDDGELESDTDTYTVG